MNQFHCLQQQYTRVAGGGQFRGGLGQGVLFAEGEGERFFDVDQSRGILTPRNIAKLEGSFPRDFELMPGEKFMVVGHKRSNEIQVYAFDRETCSLSPAGAPIAAWQPLCFKFVR